MRYMCLFYIQRCINSLLRGCEVTIFIFYLFWGGCNTKKVDKCCSKVFIIIFEYINI